MAVLREIKASQNTAALIARPGTTAAKGRSTLEALGGAPIAQTLILRNEDVDAFESLEDEITRHFAPVGPIEEYLVDLIVGDLWRLGRLARAEHVAQSNSQNLAYLSDRHGINRTDVNANSVDRQLRLLADLEDEYPPVDVYEMAEKDDALSTNIATRVPLGCTFLNSYAPHSSSPCVDIDRHRREVNKDIRENSKDLYAEQDRRRARSRAIKVTAASVERTVEITDAPNFGTELEPKVEIPAA